jgi:outer membrane cobalamin receptor
MRTALQLILLFITSTAFAQTRISGAVTDERGAAIPGANVSIEGTYDGASTSLEGVFQFETSETGAQNILITFVGFKAFRQLVNLTGEPIQLQVALREEINQLDAVVISAGSFTAGEEKRRTVLKAIDIATTAGATADIAGALNTLPGTQKVGESGRLFVRGGDGSETKTFIDGMLVANAYSPSAPNTPSRGRFLPFMFKGTSFSTGGYSAEYGQALSSNIRPYFGLINQEIDWITPPASIEGSTAFRQEVGEHGIVKFFGNFNHSDFKLNNHDILNPTQKTPFAYANNYGYGNASFLQALNDSWSVKGGLSYNYNENNIVLNDSPIDEVEKAIHAKLVFENTVSDHVELKFGVEQLQSNYEASRIDSLSLKQTVAFSTPISAGFVEAELYANKYFVTRAGVRAEYNGMTEKVNIDPRISIAYKPFTYGQFSLAYGQFRQATQNQFLRIDQNLEEEKAEHFILNYQVINNQRTFRAELYHKRYANLVKFINGNPEQLTNAGDGYAQGFELFWRDSKTVRNLDYWISYSYLDTERDYLHFPTPSTPSFASAHNFSVVGKKFISEIKSQVGVTYSYSSPRAYNNPNSESFNTGRTPAYQDLSVNVSYLPKPFLIIHLSVTNVLGRDNIFGYDYSEAPDSNGNYLSRAIRQPAKRFLFLGVFFTISKNKSVNQLPNL